ncbi:MAG: DUF4105 domain-containing protein [Bacteroidales bacterium]|nr:DUF4105 domain-containing protein [Bacteroidales bacterium]
MTFKDSGYYRILCSLVASLMSMSLIFASAKGHDKNGPAGSGADSIRISLITCYPGSAIYALDGHEAIRVKTADTDSVWNYGIFDFSGKGFVYRFVKGETDYRLAGYPFAWFMPEYVQRGSTVVEQDLNLTAEQAQKLRSMLQREGLPQNCVYRYNYLKDNCATRILDRLDSLTPGKVVYPQETRFETWRDAMKHFHRNYPWYQFGIDLALGGGLDTEMNSRQEMFVPMLMMEKVRGAHFPDGRPLVTGERVLFQGGDATLPPTPWYAGPLFWSIIVLVAALIFAAVSLWQKRLYRWPYAILFGLLGLTGCLSAFLVFVSVHEATAPNLLVLWLNPLQLVFPLFIWSRRTRLLCQAMAIVDSLVLLVLLTLWPLQNQVANPAFFPLIGATLIMSATYAINSLSPSYKDGRAQKTPPAKPARKKVSRRK